MTKMPRPFMGEIATPESDIFRDYFGKTLVNPDKLLRSEGGGRGIELYESILTDPQVASTLQTRRLAVVGREWEVVPASEKLKDRKVAEFVKDVLMSCNYDSARKALLSGVVLGYKPAEVMWEQSEGSVWVKEIIPRESRRFVFGLDRQMRILTIQNMIEGEQLKDKKFICFKNSSDNGTPYGDPLGRSLYWPVWFKKNAIKFWMIFADKFGMPTAVGKYQPGTDPKEVWELLNTLEAIQTESCIAIADNMLVELLESTRTGTTTTYEALCAFMNAEISKVVLGQTLTTEIGKTGGAYAASKTHNDVRDDYIKADADALCEAQNDTLVKWLVDFNFPSVTQYPKVWIRTDPEADLLALAQRDKILSADMGVKIPVSYVYETYGIPEPEGDEETIGGEPKPEPVQPGMIQAPAGNAQRKEVKGQKQEPDTNAEFAETLSGLFPDQTAIDKVKLPGKVTLADTLKPVVKLIQDGHSYAEIESGLVAQYPKMKSVEIEDMIARAIFVSEVWGRLNA